MTTLEDVRQSSFAYGRHYDGLSRMSGIRNSAIRKCYSAGNATLAELARATGLSKQRIHVIVREGAE